MHQFFIQQFQSPLPEGFFADTIPNQIDQLEIVMQNTVAFIINQNADYQPYLHFSIQLRQYQSILNTSSFQSQIITQMNLKLFTLIVKLVAHFHNSAINTKTINYLDRALLTYFEIANQWEQGEYWQIIAWYFKNDSSNLCHTELLRRLIEINNGNNQEFLQIQSLKLKLILEQYKATIIETDNLIGGLTQLFKLSVPFNYLNLWDESFRFIKLTVVNPTLRVHTLGLFLYLDKYFEKVSISDPHIPQFKILSQNIYNVVECHLWDSRHKLFQDESFSICLKVLTKLCSNSFALPIINQNRYISSLQKIAFNQFIQFPYP